MKSFCRSKLRKGGPLLLLLLHQAETSSGGASSRSDERQAAAARLHAQNPQDNPLELTAEYALCAAAGGASSRSDERQAAVARTYSYDTEKTCDKHRDIFMDSIRAAAEAPGQGFAAIKVIVHRHPACQHVSTAMSAPVCLRGTTTAAWWQLQGRSTALPTAVLCCLSARRAGSATLLARQAVALCDDAGCAVDAQVTALGNPHLLERVSQTLKQMRILFKTFDHDNDGFVTKQEFAEASRPCCALCDQDTAGLHRMQAAAVDASGAMSTTVELNQHV